MKLKRSDRKRRDLQEIARCVAAFYPEHKDVFLCPTCLRKIPIDRVGQITEAHIVPKAAGGGAATYLCQRCNSVFGQQQDKWLGEYLHLLKQRGAGPRMLKVKQQEGHFQVGGTRVNGRYGVSSRGAIDFVVWETANSPETLAAAEKEFARGRREGKLSVTVPLPPITRNRTLIDAGFVTAAYLLWFREVGYSWALQAHLDPIRRQILSPSSVLLPKSAIAIVNPPSDEPWVGTATLAGEVFLMAVIADHVVFFPPFDRQDAYSRLPEDLDGQKIDEADLKVLRFGWYRGHPGPLGFVLADRMMIAPDAVARGLPAPVVYFAGDGSPLQVLYPMVPTKAEPKLGLTIDPPPEPRKISVDSVMPTKDTGRDDGD